MKKKPGRPKAPTLLPTDFTRDVWEDYKEYRESAQAVAAHPGMQALLAVLVNERPSRRGNTDASFILGYESCLELLQELLGGRVREQPEELTEPDYGQTETEKELLWQKK